MTGIAENHRAPGPWDDALNRLARWIGQGGWIASQVVVIVPYAQLMAEARLQWARRHPDGFSPRFETTENWARSLPVPAPEGDELALDVARDVLVAQSLLARAGLGAQARALASGLVSAAHQIAPLAAAESPDARPAWAERLRPLLSTGLGAGVLAYEAALARIALEWAAASRYRTDALLGGHAGPAGARAGVESVVVLAGLQDDPFARRLLADWGERALSIALHADDALPVPAPACLALHEADHAADEAERAAACVLRHLAAGRRPVALVAGDRVLTRRIRALLGGAGARLRDETGWRLSTTQVAAGLMALLRAWPLGASTDAWLDALKHAPAVPPSVVDSLERQWRRLGVRESRRVPPAADPAAQAWLDALVRERDRVATTRPLTEWLQVLREQLDAWGLGPVLAADEAGQRVLAVLRLEAYAATEFEALAPARRRLGAGEFTGWVQEVLESASFVPTPAADPDVVLLPLAQLLGRDFAAVVLPGCDESRLDPAPMPPGDWTRTQRDALGLPQREHLAQVQRAAWRLALAQPHLDVLWRRSEDGLQPLMPSAWVQLLRAEHPRAVAPDPRASGWLQPTDTPPAAPRAPTLVPRRLSASAYGDLRRCPYRFFALRMLGLAEADELDAELDKRDFGNWLHLVLSHFHQDAQAGPDAATQVRRERLDAAAEQARAALALDEGEFLPFLAAWPRVREAYLRWLVAHETEGARFAQAEFDLERPLGPVTLLGRIDRRDRLGDGGTLLLDYKTESLQTTQARVRDAMEDTQLAFYAALAAGFAAETPASAAYLNLSESEARLVPQPDIDDARRALETGIVDDLERLAAGARLPALGEGTACDWCGARGLCRKDFREGT
jgi:ATP-dependent helicase/nuclease subunit B